MRFIFATHQPLEALVAERRFRQDLYYRLRVVEITVPPLRERGEADLDHLVTDNPRRFFLAGQEADRLRHL